MNWRKWTEKQIRFYLCRELHREDILAEFEAIDDVVIIPTTIYTHTQRIPSSNFNSPVEKNVLDVKKQEMSFNPN